MGRYLAKFLHFFVFYHSFIIIKSLDSYWTSHRYVTSVTTAQMQWHLSNINVILNDLTDTFAQSKYLQQKINWALVTHSSDLFVYTSPIAWYSDHTPLMCHRNLTCKGSVFITHIINISITDSYAFISENSQQRRNLMRVCNDKLGQRYIHTYLSSTKFII